jgi:hypothetical protein
MLTLLIAIIGFLLTLVSGGLTIFTFIESRQHKISEKPVIYSGIAFISLFVISVIVLIVIPSIPEFISSFSSNPRATPITAQITATAHPLISPTRNSIFVNCTSEIDLLCSPPFSITVNTKKFLKIKYINTNCSSIRLIIFVDNKKIVTTQWLGWTVTIIFPSLRLPSTTNIIDLGSVTSGQHVLALQAQGMRSGCNKGSFSEWTGTLYIYT